MPEPADEAAELPAGAEGDAIAQQLAGLKIVGQTSSGGAIYQREEVA